LRLGLGYPVMEDDEERSRSPQRPLADRSQVDGRRTRTESPLKVRWRCSSPGFPTRQRQSSTGGYVDRRVHPTCCKSESDSSANHPALAEDQRREGGCDSRTKIGVWLRETSRTLRQEAQRDFQLPSGLSVIFAASSSFVDAINSWAALHMGFHVHLRLVHIYHPRPLLST